MGGAGLRWRAEFALDFKFSLGNMSIPVRTSGETQSQVEPVKFPRGPAVGAMTRMHASRPRVSYLWLVTDRHSLGMPDCCCIAGISIGGCVGGLVTINMCCCWAPPESKRYRRASIDPGPDAHSQKVLAYEITNHIPAP